MTNPETQTDERHGLPSASGAPRLVHCAGSPAAEAEHPGDEQTAVALEGTLIHLALEKGQEDGLEVDAADVMQGLKRIELDAIDAWQKEFGIEQYSLIREERFWIRDAKLNLVMSAKPDVTTIGKGANGKTYALVLDFKSGFLDAEPASRNWQIKTQVIAVRHERPEVDYFRGAIIQHRFSSKYDPVDFDLAAIDQAWSELQFYIHLTKQPDAPRVPGSWCRYCRARGSCPQAGAFALMPQVAVPISDKEKAADMVKGLNVFQLESIRSRKSLIVAILDAVNDQMKQLPDDQLALVGLQLKPSNPARTIPNVQKAYELLVKEGMITDDEDGQQEFRTLCKVGVGDLEELIVPRVKQKFGLKTINEAKEKTKKLIAPIIIGVAKEPQLKPLK